MSKLTYYTPLTLGGFLQTRFEVITFVIFVINELGELASEHINDPHYIPPSVYSDKGRCFNFDYNFLIICLSKYCEDKAIEGDFILTENANSEVVKNGLFLVVSILEMYHGIVRIRNKKVDIARYKNAREIEIKDRFFNVICIQNGSNIKRFSAVPFSASELKKILPESEYRFLDSITNKAEFEQIAFGMGPYLELIRTKGVTPEPVTE